MGGVGCHGTPAPAAPETKAVSEAPPEPTMAPACDPEVSDRADFCSYPADVRDFVNMRDACDHWRGEPIPEHEDDPEGVRKKQIIDAMNESCAGTDKRLAALKSAYAQDPRILKLLDEFEPDVESDD
ncbi:MAG: hypothetical protein QM719_12575 [Thermomonas sp.]